MPISTVFDTSVLIKWFRQGEVLAEQALALRDAYLEGQLMILVPSLVAYELANVMRYKSDLSTDRVQVAVQSLFDMGLDWVMPSKALMNNAVEIARRYDITVYDSTFVALAESLNSSFITADKRLQNQLEELSFIYFLGEIKGVKNGELVQDTDVDPQVIS